MSEATLMSDGYVVGRGIDNPELVRVRFTGGGDAFNIILPIELCQPLAQEIDNASVQSKPQPIGPDELGLGAVFQPVSCQVRARTNGGSRLQMMFRMDDGVRTMG